MLDAVRKVRDIVVDCLLSRNNGQVGILGFITQLNKEETLILKIKPCQNHGKQVDFHHNHLNIITKLLIPQKFR